MPVKYTKLETVRYIMDREPDCAGIFLCVVPLDDTLFTEDVVLQFDGNAWFHCGSDAEYRGDVLGFIGPIERFGTRLMETRRARAEDPFDV